MMDIIVDIVLIFAIILTFLSPRAFPYILACVPVVVIIGIIANVEQKNTDPVFLGRLNERWRFGKDSYQIEQDEIRIGVKTLNGRFYSISKEEISNGILHSLDETEKGVLVMTTQNNDRYSLISNYVCSFKSYSRLRICNSILYHHTCSFDDDLSKDPGFFIIRFAEEIFGISTDIGNKMYFDETVSTFIQFRQRCNQFLLTCLDDLVLSPLKKYALLKESKKYLIVVNFIEDCMIDKPKNISYLLQALTKLLPNKFRFVFIARHTSDIRRIWERFPFLRTFNVFTRITSVSKNLYVKTGIELDKNPDVIGYGEDNAEFALDIIYLVCFQYVGLHRKYFHPYAIVIYYCFIKQVTCLATCIYFLILCFILIWFYKLDLRCDNFAVHCIIDERLEKKYFNLRSLYRIEKFGEIAVKSNQFIRTLTKRKSTIDEITGIKQTPKALHELEQTSMGTFETLYSLKTLRVVENQESLQQRLLTASEKRLAMQCRWLLENLRNKGVTNKDIERALDIAMTNKDLETTKCLSWCITKSFYKTFQACLENVLDVYPGVQCQCLNKSSNAEFCSITKLLNVTTTIKIRGIPLTYKGFRVNIINVREQEYSKTEIGIFSESLSTRFKDSHYLNVRISNLVANRWFKRHSNLTLIFPCVLRSSSFGSNHYLKNELCIKLICKQKGIIPAGETHFPTEINGIPTDIVEGDPCLISKLRVGDKIGQKTSVGTLGGFMKYLDFECFLTCAHVLYDVKTLLSSSSEFARLAGAKAYNHTSHGVIECGKVIWRTFEHDDRLRTSIDAALVLLQNNAAMDPNDYILDGNGFSCPFSKLGLSSPYLNTSCLDHEDFCGSSVQTTVVAAGAMTQLEHPVQFPKQTEVEILFSNQGQMAGSANANIFQPLWLLAPAHMRLTTGQLTDKRVFCMYNQIVVNLGLQPGDSGTCIYVVQHPTSNGCIGMAIAFCGGLAIITPLKDILKRISS